MTATQVTKGEQLEQVRDFVRAELCDKNQLERNAFQMSERVLTKRGQPCGLYFCIYGPRSVRLTAVWDFNSGSIFFYDSMGRRAANLPAPAFAR